MLKLIFYVLFFYQIEKLLCVKICFTFFILIKRKKCCASNCNIFFI